MNRGWLYILGFLFLTSAAGFSHLLAAAETPALLQAQREAEKKGHTFIAGHDEIVNRAKSERSLRALSSLPPEAMKAMRAAFKTKYPFIDIHVEEIDGNEAAQRFILEMKTGRAQAWDANSVLNAFYSEYPPYQKKFDILGMAEHGVLKIPTAIIDPIHRNIVAVASNIQVVAYNRNLIPPEKVPSSWEDFLKPDYKGGKFVADIRPAVLSVLVPAWGLEKTLDYARKIAAQQPLWARGYTRALTAMLAGEYALALGPNFGAVKRAQARDAARTLHYKIVEPVPVRLAGTDSVLATAAHPYAALLWLEFQASPEGQELVDRHWPYGASVFVPGSSQEEVTRGRKLSVMNWDHFIKIQDYEKKLVEAYGFPTADKRL